MKWVIVCAAVVAVLASSATAWTPCGCEEYTCFRSLSDCKNPDPIPASSRWEGDGEVCPPDYPYLSCNEKSNTCRYASNCSIPIPPTPPKCKCKTDIKCYYSLDDCKYQRNAATFSNGRNSECLLIERPYYACWEEPTVCLVSETCKPPHGGNGNQDPHFNGFDGSDFYFEGEAGHNYNIISDANLQVNALFIRLNELKGTYMGRLGFLVSGHSIIFDPHFGVFFNNTLMMDGSVDLGVASFAVERSADGLFRVVFQDNVYHIVARAVAEHGMRSAAYVNLQATLVGRPINPHGILGQTARFVVNGVDPNPEAFRLAGTDSDYLVRDGIIGVNFAFNSYAGRQAAAEEPITGSGFRARA